MLELFSYTLYALIQGITEFLPVSSTGHLVIAEYFLPVPTSEYFEALLHIPTFLVIVIFLWKYFFKLKKEEWVKVLISAIPAGVIGLLLGDLILDILYYPMVIALSLILWGVVYIIITTIYQKRGGQVKKQAEIKKVSIKQSILIGLWQIIALIPGTSRSGVTTVGGMISGLDIKTSAVYSFISGSVLIAAAGGMAFLKTAKSVIEGSLVISPFWLIYTMVGTFLFGLLGIEIFLNKNTLKVLKWSGIYRIILGIAVLLFFLYTR